LESYIFETRITSEVIIKFLDIFVKKINKLTVIVLDNAPIHKSKAFQKKIMEWRKQKLEIYGNAYLLSTVKFNRDIMAIYQISMA
jgi:transposase